MQEKDMTPATEERAVDSSFSPRAGTSRLHQTVPTDASPDSKCPICLDRFDNVAYLDRCLHRFCFRCVQEWSKNKAECPLCKQPFHSIIHTVRAEDDFKEYILKPSENGSFASPNGRRFRYRTTVTREHRTTSSQRSSSSRRTLSPPDNGILFEAFSSQPVQQRDVGIQQMIRRLASRRQASAEGRSLRQIQEQEIINFRRALYRSGVRIRSVQDGGRYREISAEFFRRNPACLHRYDLGKAYDQHANYDCPAPSYDEGSHSESSIITISPDEADSQEPDHNASTTESSDEEPARNGSDAQGQSQANTEPNDISDASSENCVIVGYVKPLAERTPELVELSSDSEESVAEEKSENVKKPQPIQFHSFSDSEATGCGFACIPRLESKSGI
ncbi:E3 ubiquitin-protein ligase Topors isoform A [Alligator mississippiensis]|uniref:E3 ubiquitin-protein ligase Topors n=1 Tax=Alligator mississippiensis TaxID=8496 RepID=A0A151NET4_ALLMI|nr:E3 ubiquitin-protein ligase Topors isoform A [Alligator mississippiensis]